MPFADTSAIEQSDPEGAYRIFLVMAPDDLQRVGDMVFDRLLADLDDLGASLVWAREHVEDRAIRADLARRGFTERSRFTPHGHREMVVLDRHLPA